MRRVALFAALTALMTWPMAWHLSSLAPPHHDIFFNMWRLQWFAHAAVTPSARLFDTNIFFPEPRTLALSDAMLVEASLAAPLIWAGLKPLLVHNLVLLGGICLSGAAMFSLAKYLTGSRGAAVLAGIVFAFAPYRFEHIMHMELQWAVWSPLAFLALHRVCDTGRMRYGVSLGACLALQMLSSIYYGIFLTSLIGVAAVLCLPRDRRATLGAVTKALAAGLAVAAVASALYALPYMRTHQRIGDRPDEEIAIYSATPANYLAATTGNWLYGKSSSRGRPERRLFPGAMAVVLGLIALLSTVPARRPIVYLLLLVAAFEASLGTHGYSYSFLHDHVSIYRGLRAPARLGIFVLMFLGVLAAYGYQAIVAGRSRVWRMAALSICAAVMLVEYRVDMPLVPYANTAPPIYHLLASLPRGVVAEFPTPRADRLPGHEPGYAYMSTFHWFPLVNGYSGTYPPSYIGRLDRLEQFPDERSIRQLQRDSVRYVVVHQFGYGEAELAEVRTRIETSSAFMELGRLPDADGAAWLYRMR